MLADVGLYRGGQFVMGGVGTNGECASFGADDGFGIVSAISPAP